MNVLNKLKKTSASILAMLGIMFFGLSALVYALTDAGEVITNIASVDYEDENGNSYTATSNEAEVTVGSVFNATIEADSLAVDAAPGQTVYIPYIITNTGNDTDTYTLTFVNEAGNGAEGAAAGTDIDGTGLAVYLEETVNGQPDAGEDIVTSVEVPAGESAFLVVAVTVPSSAVANDELGVLLTATSTNTTVDDITPDAGNFAGGGDAAGNGEDDLDGTVQGLITVTTGAVLVPTKSSTLDIGAGANGQITYTLTLKNNGGDAVNVDIYDAIPANTTYTSGSITFSGLLDRAGTSDDDQMLDFSVVANPAFEVIDAGTFDGNSIGPDFATGDNVEGSSLTTQTLPEPTGVDMDGDGTAGEAAVDGFFLRDVSLENGVTVSITYTVDINAGLSAGTTIENTYCSGENIFNDAANTFDVTGTTCSNTVIDTIPQVYGVDADDTDGDGDGTPGDGTDDPGDTATVGDDEDGFDDDNQFENTASVGETVDLRNVITNNGNGPDNFNLAIDSGVSNTFPTGTLFTFWDATGSVPLTDDSGDGIPDTGNLAAGASVTVTVRAQLPASIGTTTIGGAATINFQNNQYFIDVASGGNTANVWDGGNGDDDDYATAADNERFSATMTATSVGSLLDADAATASDTKTESLGAITAAGVDLANATMTDTDGANNGISANVGDLAFITVGGAVAGVDADETDAGEDDFIANLFDATSNVNGDDGAAGATSIDAADDASDFSTTYNVDVGETFTVNLVVANEAGSPDAFILSAASFATATANSTQAVSGFAAGMPAGWTVQFQNQAGAVITSTPSIPGGSVYAFNAVVTVSSDGGQALDGTDYYLAFAVNSASNGATAPFTDPTTGVADVKVDLVQINAFCSISIIPNGSEQVQPGGTEDFEHTLANDGNSDKIFDLRTYVDTDDAGADDDSWTSTLFVDTTGDDLPDTALAATTTGICYYNAASTQVCTLNAAAPNASGTASITLAPGEQVFLWNRVFAPATAADGAIKTSAVEADVTDTGAAACAADPILATDTATVILGQIRLNKTVAVDTDCDCNSQGLTFTEVAATTVNPGQCVIWRLTAENEGSVDADNVVINDAVTQFSVIASAGDYTTNPSGNTVAPVPPGVGTARVVALCESENNGGTPLDCSGTDAAATANMIAKTLTAADDEVDFVSPNVTFRAGFGADGTNGGTLIPGDVAVAQFCVQVE